MTEIESKVVQVTNVSPTVTKDQMMHFFEYVGRVKDMKLYPEVEDPMSVPPATKVCYVRYESADSAKVALHLGNTVFVDRALIVVPFPDINIPDEMKAMRVAAPANAVAGILPPTVQWPSQVVNMICGTGSQQTIQTIDSKLVEHGLPMYPPLPGNTEPSKIEEIRRTVYASNLDSCVTIEQLMQFFSQAGEVKYVRMAGDETMPSRNAYVEFTSQKSVPMALGYSGVMLNGRPLKVAHSLSVIANKPQTKNEEALAKEIDEAMKKVKESQHVMAAAAAEDPKRRSRSTSKSRKKHSRSRSKDRRRSRERRRSSHLDKNAEKPTKVSRDRHRRSRSHDRSRDKKKRSRTPPRGHRSAQKSRSKSRDKQRRRSRSKSRDRKESSSKTRGSSLTKNSGTPSKTHDDSITKPREDKVSDKSFTKDDDSINTSRNGEAGSVLPDNDQDLNVEAVKGSGDSLALSHESVDDSLIQGAEGDAKHQRRSRTKSVGKEERSSRSRSIDKKKDQPSRSKSVDKKKEPASRSRSPDKRKERSMSIGKKKECASRSRSADKKRERSKLDDKSYKRVESSSKRRRSRSPPTRKSDDRSSRRSTSRSRTRRSASKSCSKRSRSRARRSTSKSRMRRSASKSRSRRSASKSRRRASPSKPRSGRKSRSRSRQRRERSRSKDKRRRSRSTSADHRAKKKKDRSRSRDRANKSDRDRHHRSSTDISAPKDRKPASKDKESGDEKKDVKIKRDYDEEEKGFDSGNEKTENSGSKVSNEDLTVKAEPSEDGKSEDMVTDDKSEDMVMDDKSDDAANAEDSRSSFLSSNAAGDDSQH